MSHASCYLIFLWTPYDFSEGLINNKKTYAKITIISGINKQEMLHIFTIAVRQIIYTFALAIENSQILMFSRITFQKRRKFGFYFRFPSFCFLEVKPLDFLCE